MFCIVSFAVSCSEVRDYISKTVISEPGEAGTAWAVGSSILTLHSKAWRDSSFLGRRLLNCTEHLLIYQFVCQAWKNQKSPTLLQEKTK